MTIVPVLPKGGSDFDFSGDLIAFRSFRDGQEELYLMTSDGSSKINITKNPAADREGQFEIYVMNVDGTGITRLTDNSARDSGPGWSPDGGKIAFRSNRDGNSEIYVMNVDGTNPVRLTTHSSDDDYPEWRP